MITVSILTKSYVFHYLSLKYGNPANISCNPELYSLFRRCLIKPNKRFESNYRVLSPNIYSKEAKIIISEDDFYRYGWEISNTDIVAFGKTVEAEVKKFMRATVAAYEIAVPQKTAIIQFQEDYGFSEDIWSFEAIKKDYYRSNASYGKNILSEIFNKIKEKSLENMSHLRTNLT